MRYIAITLFVFVLSGCKINYSFTGASISPEVKTFSVAYIENVASIIEPSLSNLVTEGLKDKFLSETSLSLVNSGGNLEFEGRITRYEQEYSGLTKNETASQNRLTIGISITFTNNIEPLKSFETTFSAYDEYDSEKSLDEVEAVLIANITEEIIEAIFMKAVADW